MLADPEMKSARISLPVRQAAPARVECTSCARCCTYVGVGINAPTTARYATDVLWYLYHENVSVYLDSDGEWSVHFEARCRNLGDDLRCRVYERRPHVCRAFDDTSCEVNAPNDEAITFREPAQFLDWLARARPRLHARIVETHVPEPLAKRPRARRARERAPL
jgi:Fe-S-cluster containining protein